MPSVSRVAVLRNRAGRAQSRHQDHLGRVERLTRAVVASRLVERSADTDRALASILSQRRRIPRRVVQLTCSTLVAGCFGPLSASSRLTKMNRSFDTCASASTIGAG